MSKEKLVLKGLYVLHQESERLWRIKSKVKSPTGKSMDYIFTNESTLEDVELPFTAINYDDVTVASLNMHAIGSTVTMDVKVLSKRRKLINGKTLDTSLICNDICGYSKLSVWEEAVPSLVSGQVYKLCKVKVKKDLNMNIKLSVMIENIEKSAKKIKKNEAGSDPSFFHCNQR